MDLILENVYSCMINEIKLFEENIHVWYDVPLFIFTDEKIKVTIELRGNDPNSIAIKVLNIYTFSHGHCNNLIHIMKHFIFKGQGHGPNVKLCRDDIVPIALIIPLANEVGGYTGFAMAVCLQTIQKSPDTPDICFGLVKYFNFFLINMFKFLQKDKKCLVSCKNFCNFCVCSSVCGNMISKG